MRIEEYIDIIKKYEKKYNSKLDILKNKYDNILLCFDKNKMKEIMYEYKNLIKKMIYEIINEFEEFKEIKCAIMLNGSYARSTNLLYSDIDLNYFYDNKYFNKMIIVEDRVNYILEKILKFRGKDRIHSMTVYLPLVRDDYYEFFDTNLYPIKFSNDIIYSSCRENSKELMYQTYNSTRNIDDIISYLNKNDNENILKEWTNTIELVYDNGLFEEFFKKRKIFKDNKNINAHITNLINSIKNDDYYCNSNRKTVAIKDLKFFYKMSVLNNVYTMLSIYFRLNKNFDSINLKDFEEKNIGLDTDFYTAFYYHLYLIQRLQKMLDIMGYDLSFHSTKRIKLSYLNEIYKDKFAGGNIIIELNESKKELYRICNKYLNIKEEE